MLRHTGTTYGYSSLITLLPDANLGVFISMTGENEGYITRTLKHSYLLDTFLGVEPTINVTTVCTYPEPWYRSSHSLRAPIDKTIQPTRSLTDYVGSYHQIAYGDIVIRMNATVNQLQMDYGIGHWILYPENTHDTFAGEAFGLMYKLVDLSHVKFHVHSHSVVSVEIPGFESKAPPVFVKRKGTGAHGGPGIVG